MKTHAGRHGDPRHAPEDIARLKARVAELEETTNAQLHWVEVNEYGWTPGHMDWRCRCGQEVSLTWVSDCCLYDTDEPIVPADAITSSWKLSCHTGHVLLLAHELGDDFAFGDTCPAPTTGEIAERLASAEDVAAWREWVVARAAKFRAS